MTFPSPEAYLRDQFMVLCKPRAYKYYNASLYPHSFEFYWKKDKSTEQWIKLYRIQKPYCGIYASPLLFSIFINNLAYAINKYKYKYKLWAKGLFIWAKLSGMIRVTKISWTAKRDFNQLHAGFFYI